MTSFFSPLSTPFFFTASLLLTAHSTTTHATDTSPTLETQIVSAQKRDENALDVPISIAVVDGEKMADAGIQNLEDLSVYLPNIHFTETGFSTQVRIRGIGSDNSQGFEQSVGTYIDGIYYGRAQLFRAPFFDLERAELLRGPQSILFGKNSIAGALNLTTAKPTEDTLMQVSVSHEFEHKQNEVQGVLNGAISDSLRARFAFREYEEDGYYRNTYKNRDEPQRDQSAFRLSLAGDLGDSLDVFLKAEHNEFNTQGRPFETTYDVALVSGQPNYAQTLAALGQAPLESESNFERQYDGEERSDNELNSLTLQLDYALEHLTLNFVTGYLDFDYDELCDCDNTPAEILSLGLGEDFSQFSQEIRAHATFNKVDWVAGLYYQQWDQDFYDRLSISPSNLMPTTLSSLPGGAALALLADTGLHRDFEQESESWALFAQATWHIHDQLRVTAGLRYTEEKKEASKVLDLFTPSTQEALNDPIVGLVYLNVFEAENEQATVALVDGEPVALPWSGHNVEKDRREEAFTPRLGVEYDLRPNSMLYATYSAGFKAGGFDPRSNSVGNFTGAALSRESDPYRNFEFEEETADAYELGIKNRLYDGRGELNLALFQTDYHDLQISQFGGAVDFNIGNAKEARVRGLELDARWALSDNLTSGFNFAWLDFEYLDFKNGNCHATQTKDGIDLDGDDLPDTCDYSGKRGVYTPDYTANITLDYTKPLTDALRLTGFIDAQYVDGHNVHVNLAPEGQIDGYTYLSAKIGIEGEHWSLALLGKNLLDEYIISYSANSPLSQNIFSTNTFYSIARRPRTVALQGALRF